MENKKEPDEYDELFGYPKTEVFCTKRLLDYLDLAASRADKEDPQKDQKNKHRFKTKTVVVTGPFEKSVKLLFHMRRTDIIREIKKAITELADSDFGDQEKDCEYKDLPLKGGDKVMKYRNLNGVLVVAIDTEDVTRLANLNNASVSETAQTRECLS